ncbi:hypothetical protein OG196_14205 [Kitasatospora purpeofusca]|uniref:hypothetical protein n=1 Tax=Kitasatospora purpeofusca TaxID=67352 RepID=UPI002E13B0C5|nr:hypothetical protein OG196_14205 [Kitasatospora purpeofusca]
MRNATRIIATTLAGAFLVAAGSSQAMAGGNYGYNCSLTSLSRGKLYTCIYTEDLQQPDGSLYWKLVDTYEKKSDVAGTITAKFGFNYHGYSYEGGWFSQSQGETKDGWFYDLGFNDCNNIVGWMAVQGQQTFANAPVSIC